MPTSFSYLPQNEQIQNKATGTAFQGYLKYYEGITLAADDFHGLS